MIVYLDFGNHFKYLGYEYVSFLFAYQHTIFLLVQVRVRWREERPPLEEEQFRPFLYHYDGPKFRLELSVKEVYFPHTGFGCNLALLRFLILSGPL